MKRFIFYTLSVLFLSSALNAEIIKTSNIQDIREEITENTLVLFNIAEVLTDTETSLGSQAWRKFIRETVSSEAHDALTLYAFKNVPSISPDPSTPELVKELQAQGTVTFAFTSRGRHEWYASQVPDIDLITESVLNKIGFDFSETQLPEELAGLSDTFEDYYHDGIFYATNTRDKGELLVEILSTTGYKPSKIIFVDDKIDSLTEVEEALSQLDIPFIGYAYSQTKLNHPPFNPLVADFQLNWLMTNGHVLPDNEISTIMEW